MSGLSRGASHGARFGLQLVRKHLVPLVILRLASFASFASFASYASYAALVASLVVPRVATAQGARAQTIHVLAIDSDDADDQADALTVALRARIRDGSGFTLLETTQSLSMLTAAFRCPQHPDAACLDRIGDKLKADQLVWGILVKAPGHQVTAEVHLWRRAKPDQVTRETYSDNLREGGDDGLRRVASLILGKVLGGALGGGGMGAGVGVVGGTVVIHANADTGTILVDGERKAALEHGAATLSLPPGPHTIEVQSAGFLTVKRDLVVQVSGNAPVEIALVVDPAAMVVTTPHKPLPVRAIVGWSSIVAGGILGATGLGFGIAWENNESALHKLGGKNDYGDQPLPVNDPCSPPVANGTTRQGCSDQNAAHSDVAGEIITFSLGGLLVLTGIYLVATDHPAAATTAATSPSPLANVRILPTMGAGSGSLLVLGSF